MKRYGEIVLSVLAVKITTRNRGNMDKTEKATVLREAANVIQERGLARGTLEDLFGHVCLAGAINCAATGDPNKLWCDTTRTLVDHLNRMVTHLGFPTYPRSGGCGERTDPAIQWSNDWAKDADDVAHLLKLTAEDVELSGD